MIYRKNAGANTTWRLVLYEDTSVTGLPVTPDDGNIVVTWNAPGMFTLSDKRAKENLELVGDLAASSASTPTTTKDPRSAKSVCSAGSRARGARRRDLCWRFQGGQLRSRLRGAGVIREPASACHPSSSVKAGWILCQTEKEARRGL